MENQQKLIKISKRYTNRSIKSWDKPPRAIISSINKVLQMNKTKTLQITSSNKKNSNLIQQDIDLDEFIRLYLKQLQATKLPLGKNLNEFDYDHDYQLHKENFLSTLYSNELNQVQKLKDNVTKEDEKCKSIKKFVGDYEKLYNEELRKLTQMDEVTTNSSSTKELNNLQTLELQSKNDDTPDELTELLKQLDNQLDKIDTNTKHYQDLSSKLDEIMNPI